jgi:hypothetical protein
MFHYSVMADSAAFEPVPRGRTMTLSPAAEFRHQMVRRGRFTIITTIATASV